MELEHRWQVENEVAYIKIGGSISIDDLREMNQIITREYVEPSRPPVHLIFDLNIVKYPTRVSELKDNITLLDHQNIGWIFVVNPNPIINMLAMMVSKFTKGPYKAVSSAEDAMSFISQIDKAIPERSL